MASPCWSHNPIRQDGEKHLEFYAGGGINEEHGGTDDWGDVGRPGNVGHPGLGL